jgi:hypothetical protein
MGYGALDNERHRCSCNKWYDDCLKINVPEIKYCPWCGSKLKKN